MYIYPHSDMLRPFDEEAELGITHYIPSERVLVTAERSRLIKFWELPKQWRDAMV